MLLAGIDLAWRSTINCSAIAVAKLEGCDLTLHGVSVDRYSAAEIADQLSGSEVDGVAIDAPLIIRNLTGQRRCETELGKDYSLRKASCHTANLTLYPDADSVRLSSLLQSRGFSHLGNPPGRWQIECYPHPALIEIFDLPERLLYKKGRIEDRKNGQVSLARLLRRLCDSPNLRLIVPDHLSSPFDEGNIRKLSGTLLKRNEDILDAIVCAYVAGLFASGIKDHVYGVKTDGYIYVPWQKCVPS